MTDRIPAAERAGADAAKAADGPGAPPGPAANTNPVGNAAVPTETPRPQPVHEFIVTGKDVSRGRKAFAARSDLEPNAVYHVEPKIEVAIGKIFEGNSKVPTKFIDDYRVDGGRPMTETF